MKLTNTIRDSFVRAAMQDVPQIDYAEQIRKSALDAVVAALPKAVRDAWTNEATRPYIETTYITYGGVSVTVPGFGRYNQKQQPELSEAAVKKLAALAERQKAANDQYVELSKKLRGAAYAVTTRKALAEMLPEFEKYLPADEAAACKTLPVVANLVADFTKAGWPKGKKTAKAGA